MGVSYSTPNYYHQNRWESDEYFTGDVWYRRREPSVSPDGIVTSSIPTHYLLSSAVEIVTRQRVAEQLENLILNTVEGNNSGSSTTNNQERFFHSSLTQSSRRSVEDSSAARRSLIAEHRSSSAGTDFDYTEANRYNQNLQFSCLYELFSYLLQANEIRLKENLESIVTPMMNNTSDDNNELMDIEDSSTDEDERPERKTFRSPLSSSDNVTNMSAEKLRELFARQQSYANLLIDTRERAFWGGYCNKYHFAGILPQRTSMRMLRKRTAPSDEELNYNLTSKLLFSGERLQNYCQLIRQFSRHGSDANSQKLLIGNLNERVALIHMLRARECGVSVTNMRRSTCGTCRREKNKTNASAAPGDSGLDSAVPPKHCGSTLCSNTSPQNFKKPITCPASLPTSSSSDLPVPPVVNVVRGCYRAYAGGFTKAQRAMLNNDFLPNQMRIVDTIPSKIFCVSYMNNGNEFITASQDYCIRRYAIGASNRERYLLRETLTVPYVGWSIIDTALSPDGRHLLYTTWNEPIYQYDFEAPENGWKPLHIEMPERNRYAFFSLRFNADGREVVVGANDHHIYIYDRAAGQCVLSLNAHEDDVNSVCFGDAASHLILSAGDDGLCKVWDRRTMGDLDGNHPVGTFAGHRDGITFIDARGDDRYVLTNSKDQTVKLWDMRIFASEAAVASAKLSISHQDWDYRYNRPSFVQTRMEGDCSVATLSGHAVLHTLVRARFSPEHTGKRYVYTGCARGNCLVYDVLTGETAKLYTGHSGVVRDCAWNPRRNEIVTTSWDGRTYLWRYDERRNAIAAITATDCPKKTKSNADSEDSCDENYQPIRKRNVVPSYTKRLQQRGKNHEVS